MNPESLLFEIKATAADLVSGWHEMSKPRLLALLHLLESNIEDLKLAVNSSTPLRP